MRLRESAREALEEAVRRGQEEGALPRTPPPPALHLEAPRDPERGDLSANLALAWARASGRSPVELAGLLVDRLPASPFFQEVRVEGPGFLNFSLSPRGFEEIVRDVLRRGPLCARTDGGAGREVVVPRAPGSPRTLAEVRQEALLEVRSRLLEATGHRVLREGVAGRPRDPVRLTGGHDPVPYPELADRLGLPVLRFLLLEREGPLELDPDLAEDPTLANPARRVLYAWTRVEGLLPTAAALLGPPACGPALRELPPPGAPPREPTPPGPPARTAFPRPDGTEDLSPLGTPAERELIRLLEELPWLCEAAARQDRPHLLAGWALALAGRFHPYYNHEQILGPVARTRRARVALAQAVGWGLEAACGILGVDLPGDRASLDDP